MRPDRRALLTGAITAGAGALGVSATRAESIGSERQPDQIISLWPDTAPGKENPLLFQRIVNRSSNDAAPDRVAENITQPTLSIFRAHAPNGGAILIAPGGGYRHVTIDKNGYDLARWFAARGVTAYVLLYRLPHQRWSAGPDTPLQDAQRAMRLIRARAASDGVDAQRIAVVGFSAGGHVASMLATRWDAAISPSCDAADALSARPNMAGLFYAVVTLARPFAHEGSRERLLGSHPNDALIRTYSAETNARADMGPIFLAHASDDGTVLPQNSIMLFQAAIAVGARAELHIFEKGSHGFGLDGIEALPVRTWPELFWNFGADKGVFEARASQAAPA